LASLPDLIFTVLFFFMIVTHMRDVSPHVRYEVPEGKEVTKDGRKAGMVYIFIGKPVDAQGRVTGDKPRIQLNDRYVALNEIGPEIARQRSKSGSGEVLVSIHADRDTEMGLINDVKQELRRAGALDINYAATEKK